MAQKKTADRAALQTLKQQLSSGQPGQLYLFHGEEVYLRDFYLSRLRDLLVGGGMEEFNLHALQGPQVTPQSLEEAVDCLPMMSQRTLVLLTDFDPFKAGEADRGRYAEILGSLPDYCCVVLVYDLIPYKADSRTKLAAVFREKGLVVQFARQEQGDLVDWIRRRFRALGRDIDSELARYLIFLCGDLMNGLIGEIEKIGAYAKGSRVTRQDIDAVATPQLDAVVFQMTDAIAAGKADRAARVLGDLYHMQEHPIKILAALGRQVRQLYAARLALESHRGADYLVSLCGFRSAYPAQKLLDSARRFPLSWCRWAMARCGQTDLAMKSGGGDGQELLTALLMELSCRGRDGAC